MGFGPVSLVVSVLPSAESVVVAVLISFPFYLIAISHLALSICFHAAVPPKSEG